jgi:hypothetical protein
VTPAPCSTNASSGQDDEDLSVVEDDPDDLFLMARNLEKV